MGSIAANLVAGVGWLRNVVKLAVLGMLGLGVVPLLVGASVELALLPFRCEGADRDAEVVCLNMRAGLLLILPEPCYSHRLLSPMMSSARQHPRLDGSTSNPVKFPRPCSRLPQGAVERVAVIVPVPRLGARRPCN